MSRTARALWTLSPRIWRAATGSVATYGFSYHGMNQYMALAGAAERGTRKPDAMAIVMAALRRARPLGLRGRRVPARGRPDVGAPDGQWRSAQARGRPRPSRAARGRGANCTPAPSPAHPESAGGRRRPHPLFRLARRRSRLLGARSRPPRALPASRSTSPTLHVGGWHDLMLAGTLAAHRRLRRQPARSSGPGRIYRGAGGWARSMRATRRRTGSTARSSRSSTITLKGREDSPAPRVRLYDVGVQIVARLRRPGRANANTLTLYLASGGRAGASTARWNGLGEAPVRV